MYTNSLTALPQIKQWNKEFENCNLGSIKKVKK